MGIGAGSEVPLELVRQWDAREGGTECDIPKPAPRWSRKTIDEALGSVIRRQ